MEPRNVEPGARSMEHLSKVSDFWELEEADWMRMPVYVDAGILIMRHLKVKNSEEDRMEEGESGEGSEKKREENVSGEVVLDDVLVNSLHGVEEEREREERIVLELEGEEGEVK
jgi:hypothetical protein